MINFKYNFRKISKVYNEEGYAGLMLRINRLYNIKSSTFKTNINEKKFSTLSTPIKQNEITSNSSVVYTIVSKNYMHYALTVRESFLNKNKNTDFVIFLMDKIMNKEELLIFNQLIEDGVHIIGFDEVSNNVQKTYFSEMLFKFTVLEMNTGLKPFAMEYLMNKGYEKVMYIDPDIYFYQPIDKILSQLDKNDILLTPHMLKAYDDEKQPSELAIMMAGTYNLGFLAIRNNLNTLNMVRWWQERLYKFGFSDIKNGMFTDQKWMDLTPSLYDNVNIFKDPGHNVAYWNMHEREIENKDGIWFVNEEPLVFFHFSGLPLYDINVVSKHQNRHSLNQFNHLKPLFQEYTDVVKSFAPSMFSKMQYYYNFVAGSSLKIDDFLRKGYKELFKITENPTSSCLENIDIISNYFFDKKSMLNKHSRLLYDIREDLQIAFPNLDNSENSKKGFIDWYNHEYGNIKYNDSAELQFGINLIGYFDNVIGVAQVARNFCKNSLFSSLPISIDVVNSPSHPKISVEEELFYSKYKCKESKLENNFIFVNADVIEDYKKHFPTKLDGKKNYGIWWWEFDDYFPFISAFSIVDELIVFTDFIADALKKVAPENFKINKMPYPFIQDWDKLIDKNEIRNKYNINTKDFVFIFNFDFLSSYERKNPEAILQAFYSTFKDKVNNVKLVFKVTNSDSKNNDYRKFINVINDLKINEYVLIINESLSRNEMISLINAADCYISLHRSEGLGLGMLEAMSLGLPVIATSFGGNLEFMNKENSCLVNFNKIEVKSDFGPYKKGWLWAEPDIVHASSHMYKLYNDTEYKIKISQKASESIKKQFNNVNFSKSLYKLLSEK